jgi:hypothetical protein
LPTTFEGLHDYSFAVIGKVVLKPYLAIPNPSFKEKKAMEFLTVLFNERRRCGIEFKLLGEENEIY